MASRGSAGFDTYYSARFGDRWPRLRDSLLTPPNQVARLNGFLETKLLTERFPLERRHQHGRLIWVESNGDLSPQETPNGLADCHVMDLASVFPPLALDPQPGDRVLDMCAAPGGKSLILAEALREAGELVANEISDNRRSRLFRVIREYVPASQMERVRVTGHDAARWCLHEPDAFDRILLDAPCSGERHLLADTTELKKWSEARTKNLAVRQYALLASALATVKPGGRIVYSTCALSPRENDEVVARLLKRREGESRVIPVASLGNGITPPIGEATEHGWQLLPDQTGYGPIYFSVLERT